MKVFYEENEIYI